jgi:3-oxoacyl-[acyl-carrier protein] reductase
VLISSISGSKPAPRAQYGVTKAGLIYLSAALARELAPVHIRVNTVSPGSILFPGGGWDSLRLSDPARLQRFIDQDLPAGRLGTAQEVADVVTFLLSPVAHWINGANIPVDGAQGRPSAAGW